MDGPDDKRLTEIGAEMDKLIREGQWTQEAYRRLYAEAKIAARGHGDELEFIYVQRPGNLTHQPYPRR